MVDIGGIGSSGHVSGVPPEPGPTPAEQQAWTQIQQDLANVAAHPGDLSLGIILQQDANQLPNIMQSTSKYPWKEMQNITATCESLVNDATQIAEGGASQDEITQYLQHAHVLMNNLLQAMNGQPCPPPPPSPHPD